MGLSDRYVVEVCRAEGPHYGLRATEQSAVVSIWGPYSRDDAIALEGLLLKVRQPGDWTRIRPVDGVPLTMVLPRRGLFARLVRRLWPAVVVLALAGCQSSPVAPSPTGPSGAVQPYDRDAWAHWLDEDGDCLNTRHEVLLEESLTPATVEDCKVVAGEWRDVYTGELHTDPRRLDVDHVVALADAHDSGGWRWSPTEKARYANDLTAPEHLVAVAAGVNRSKGARGPDEWMPPGDPCWYVVAYRAIKSRWALTVTVAERAALDATGCHGYGDRPAGASNKGAN